ncbi:MAG: ABC transporter substrate-binding protein [Eubacteriales bacterium SKADARSKE-1]|nr:ABC transporter substrate-binding protein [Eubacteriales bacterium SKADARSKE-1]
MMNKTSCGITFLIISVLAFFLLFSIYFKSNEEPINPDLIPVTIALDWTPNTNHTGLYVAKELKYFEEEGLSVNILQPPEGSATSLVASGKIQFGIDFQDFLAPALASKAPLPVKAVAAIVQHNTSGIISKKEKNILSMKELEFKTYATWDNPMEHSFLKYLMKKNGANFNNIKLIHATIDNVPAALKYDIDCAWGYFGSDAIAAKLYGVDYNFLPFKDLDNVLDYYAPIIIANNEYLKNEPETAKKFLRAVSKGYEYASENPENSANILIKTVPGLNKELIKESQMWVSTKYIDDAQSWGHIDENRWESFFDWLYEENVIDFKIPRGQGFTNEFLM